MVIPVGMVFFGLWPIVGQGKAFATAASIYLFYALISHKWNRRDDRNFWLAIGAFALLHVAGLMLISFPAEIRPSLAILPFMLLDGFLMWAALDWVQRRFPS